VTGRLSDPDLTRNVIEKADAGAQLFFSIYHLPRAVVTELFKNASPGFIRSYARAQGAFMVGPTDGTVALNLEDFHE
jgi:hypothetical protein